MGRQFNISDMGLKLIKAYEGFRPVDRTLVSGQRVVGYGHRLMSDKAVMLSKPQAEDLLKDDLAPFIDMINENVHAPLSQSQFDALVSFAYNIGPKAFLKSDTLRALNNGRPLDAANGFDIWRKSEIDGKTYVVDALMRRRAAEKALFLRPEGRPISAPGVDLPPVEDAAVALLTTEDALPVFTADEAAGIVAAAPYSAKPAQYRRREDGPAGTLTLSEVFEEDDFEIDLSEDEFPFDPEPESDSSADTDFGLNPVEDDELGSEGTRPSLIAAEDEKLKDRLNALIEDVKSEQKGVETSDWPDSLVSSKDALERKEENVIPFRKELELTTVPSDVEINTDKADIVIDNLAEDDALRIQTQESALQETRREESRSLERRTPDSASRFIDLDVESESEQKTSLLPFFIMMVFGSLLFGGSVASWLKDKGEMLGEYGSILAMCGIFIGAMLLTGAFYSAARQSFKRN
ncbi:MAG: lysozyme [Hellea sp.]